MSKSWRDLQTTNSRRKMMDGSWTCNGSSDPTLVSGTGFTVTRAGTGQYTIQLDTGYRFAELSSVNATVQAPSVYNVDAQIGDIEVASAGTITVYTVSGTNYTDNTDAAAWDYDSSLGVRVNWVLFGRTSTSHW